MTGKCHLKGRKVVGTLERLHYEETILKVMTKGQKYKVLVLHQAKSARHAAKAATTSVYGPPLSEVSDKIESFMHVTKSLWSNQDGDQ